MLPYKFVFLKGNQSLAFNLSLHSIYLISTFLFEISAHNSTKVCEQGLGRVDLAGRADVGGAVELGELLLHRLGDLHRVARVGGLGRGGGNRVRVHLVRRQDLGIHSHFYLFPHVGRSCQS